MNIETKYVQLLQAEWDTGRTSLITIYKDLETNSIKKKRFVMSVCREDPHMTRKVIRDLYELPSKKGEITRMEIAKGGLFNVLVRWVT